jgi:hypothetical protein
LSRDASRLRAYNKLLEAIYHRIRVVSAMPTHPTSIIYTIPPFILGVPRLDLQDCVVYLVWQLRNNGFMVAFTYPNMLSISWGHHERDYVANDSPIAQAMIATTPAPPAETKRGQPGHGQPKKSALKKNQGFGSAGTNDINVFKSTLFYFLAICDYMSYQFEGVNKGSLKVLSVLGSSRFLAIHTLECFRFFYLKAY